MSETTTLSISSSSWQALEQDTAAIAKRLPVFHGYTMAKTFKAPECLKLLNDYIDLATPTLAAFEELLTYKAPPAAD